MLLMILSHILIIIISILMLGIATTAGATILRCFRFSFSSGLEAAIFAFGVGVPLASYIVFGLGTVGWVTKIMVLTVFACLSVISCFSLLRLYHTFSSLGNTFMELVCKLDKQTVFLLILLFIHTVFNLIGALSLPTGPDSLNYHLGAVKYYITQGSISYVPYRAWNTPLTSEMWNLLGLLLGCITLPKLFVYSFGLVGSMAIYRLGVRIGGHSAGLLAAILYYTSTFVTTLTTAL